MDVAPLWTFKKKMAKAKHLILDGVRDHIVSHISSKGTTKEMWDGLETLYYRSSEQRKMFLEEKMWTTRPQKGEHIDPFLSRLQENLDQLAVGVAPKAIGMVRLALNSVSEDYQVFVQSILDRENLSDWESMWAALQQEEMRRDLLKCQLEGSSSSSSKIEKEEEENVALSSKGKQEKCKGKKDLSKIKCFRCCEMGHYATNCPNR